MTDQPDLNNLIERLKPYRKPFRIDSGAVSVGQPGELPVDLDLELRKAINSLGPWRKGPFQLFGHTIEANWKSDLKWNRLKPYLNDSHIQNILDIGCNSGYFLWQLLDYYRSLSDKSISVYGVDPVQKFYKQFQLIHGCTLETEQIFMDAVSYSALESNSSYDVILSMGVLYHLKNPLELLETIHSLLKTGGKLYLETITIDTEMNESNMLFPGGPYAGIRGVWFVPGHEAVLNMLKRCNFRSIEHLETWDFEKEMQSAGGMPVLNDFIDQGRKLTVEGYPLPRRSLFAAIR